MTFEAEQYRRQPGIIEHSQLPGYPRLQAFQQHHRPCPRRKAWQRITEDLAEHHRDLFGPLAARGAHLLGGSPGGDISRPPQRTLLLTAEYQFGQLLAASVGNLPTSHPPRASATNTTPAVSQPAGHCTPARDTHRSITPQTASVAPVSWAVHGRVRPLLAAGRTPGHSKITDQMQ